MPATCNRHAPSVYDAMGGRGVSRGPETGDIQRSDIQRSADHQPRTFGCELEGLSGPETYDPDAHGCTPAAAKRRGQRGVIQRSDIQSSGIQRSEGKPNTEQRDGADVPQAEEGVTCWRGPHAAAERGAAELSDADLSDGSSRGEASKGAHTTEMQMDSESEYPELSAGQRAAQRSERALSVSSCRGRKHAGLGRHGERELAEGRSPCPPSPPHPAGG